MLPDRRRRGGRGDAHDRRAGRRGEPARPGMAGDPDRPGRRRPRPLRAGRDAGVPAAVRRAAADDERLRHRPGAPHVLPAQARRARDRHLLRIAVAAHDRLQGHARRGAGAGVLPRPGRRAGHLRARDRALAVLHEHVPGVAAGAPVPLRRAQRRDQHAARQPQLDGRARGDAGVGPAAGRPAAAHPGRHPGRVGLGDVRRGAGAAAPGRAQPAARGADDDPGGVGEPRRDGPGPPGLLRVPLHADGALGRPGAGGVHRRHPDRRRARPQRPAPGPVLGDRGRPGRARLRGRRARRRSGQDRAQGPAGAGPHVPDRHRARPDGRRRRDQGRAGVAAPLRGLAARRPDPPGQPARRARARRRSHEALDAAPAGVRLHRGGAERPAPPDGRHRRRADRLDGQRRAAGRHLGAPTPALRLLHPAVRAGHEPAAGRDPGGAGHLPAQPARSGAEPAGRDARALPHDRRPVPGAHQRRPRQDRPHQRRRRVPRLRRPTPSRGTFHAADGGEGLRERLREIEQSRSPTRSRTAPG